MESNAAPTVIWITGLSGAGKTTIGKEVYAQLKAIRSNAIFLDGDVLREVLGSDLGHSPQDRLSNAYRLSRMCRLLLDQGVSVVCATMSLFPEIWEWNRKNLSHYFEVYVKVSKDTLLLRDSKGLYKRAITGQESNVIGFDVPFIEPTAPHYVINNDSLALEELSDVAADILFSAHQKNYPLGKNLFSTKANNLERVSKYLRSAQTKPLFVFTLGEWLKNPTSLITTIQLQFQSQYIVIRSSVIGEDSDTNSHAGEYDSAAFVDPSVEEQVQSAIQRVVGAYPSSDPSHQILVQEQICPIALSGVMSTRDFDTLAPYYIVNYDDISASHDSVTSGTGSNLKTWIRSRFAKTEITDVRMQCLLKAAQELEHLFDCDALDIEFAFDNDNTLFILQVRPIVAAGKQKYVTDREVKDLLEKIEKKILKLDAPHPQLCGGKALFSVMTDWNPAEMIGIKPKSLALSLYQELITNSIWAYQRDNYGYRNLRSFPLLISFMGFPYIDVRASLNSFVPRSLDEKLADKLIDYYIHALESSPSDHDKVEFNIVYSCYDLSLRTKLNKLLHFGFSELELDRITFSLLELTNSIISPQASLYIEDLKKIGMLDQKLSKVVNSELSILDQIYWLTEDCKRYGTLPFAGLARAGFIAVQFLRSLVEKQLISEDDSTRFMNSLDTVTKRLSRDVRKLKQGTMGKEKFLEQYGHLRPGTYDIQSKRYDEAFELYFTDVNATYEGEQQQPFNFSNTQMEQISEELSKNGLLVNATELVRFMKEAIEGREYGKFMFSRHVSQILVMIESLGNRVGISREALAHVNIGTVLDMYANLEPPDVKEVLQRDIENNRRNARQTGSLRLPQLLRSCKDIYEFELGNVEPNFVTSSRVTEVIVTEEDLHVTELTNKIILIKSADPGYDWVFSRKIGGLITMYGGMNSHMAIRCSELRVPAVIGCGEENFVKWSRGNRLDIDCANRQVRVLR